MPRLLPAPETVQGILAAGNERFVDAERLLQQGQPTGAGYLAGLATEMFLKHADFAVLGVAPTTPVSHLLAAARHRATGAFNLDWDSGHRLKVWALLLQADGARTRAPKRAVFRTIVTHVTRIDDRWCVAIRYHAKHLSNDDAKLFVATAREVRRLLVVR